MESHGIDCASFKFADHGEALDKHVRGNATHLFDDEDHLMKITPAPRYNGTLY